MENQFCSTNLVEENIIFQLLILGYKVKTDRISFEKYSKLYKKLYEWIDYYQVNYR